MQKESLHVIIIIIVEDDLLVDKPTRIHDLSSIKDPAKNRKIQSFPIHHESGLTTIPGSIQAALGSRNKERKQESRMKKFWLTSQKRNHIYPTQPCKISCLALRQLQFFESKENCKQRHACSANPFADN